MRTHASESEVEIHVQYMYVIVLGQIPKLQQLETKISSNNTMQSTTVITCGQLGHQITELRFIKTDSKRPTSVGGRDVPVAMKSPNN